jgi:hypothetical protein
LRLLSRDLVRVPKLLEQCPSPHLWGLSFIGTKLRVYSGDKTTRAVTTEAEASEHPTATQSQPESPWNIDMMSPEGFQKMREVTDDIFAHTDAQGIYSGAHKYVYT